MDIDLVVVVVVVVFVIIADIYTLIFIDHAAGNIYLQLGFAVIYWIYKIKIYVYMLLGQKIVIDNNSP